MVGEISEEDARRIAKLVAEEMLIATKEVLTLEEAAAYMKISKSRLYKLTMNKEIPFYKPAGKLCYFKRVELEQWLQRNPIATEQEMSDRLNAYFMKLDAGMPHVGIPVRQRPEKYRNAPSQRPVGAPRG